MEKPQLVNDTLLHMKYARIIGLLAQRLNIDEPRALGIFYTSDTYQHLRRKAFHLHNMSDAYLADEIMLELERRQ